MFLFHILRGSVPIKEKKKDDYSWLISRLLCLLLSPCLVTGLILDFSWKKTKGVISLFISCRNHGAHAPEQLIKERGSPRPCDPASSSGKQEVSTGMATPGRPPSSPCVSHVTFCSESPVSFSEELVLMRDQVTISTICSNSVHYLGIYWSVN